MSDLRCLNRTIDRTSVAAYGLTLALIGLFGISGGGHTYVTDGGAMYFMAVSILDHSWFDVPQNLNTAGGRIGADGRYYMPFGVLQPLLASPLILVGRALAAWAGAEYLPFLALTWFNAVVTALLCLTTMRFLMDLGASPGRALAAAAALGLTTPFWVYSQTFFSEPLTALGITAAARRILLYRKRQKILDLCAAGIWAGTVPLIRPLAAVALPVLLLYLLLHERAREKQDNAGGGLLPIFAFMTLILGSLVLAAGYNFIRYGSIMETGYDLLPNGQPRSFTLDPWYGASVLLFSPGKSIFIFAPVTLIALIGLRRLWRQPQHRPEAFLAAALPIMFIAILSRWARIEGGVAWGPRLLLPAVPVMFLGLLPYLYAGTNRAQGMLKLLAAFGLLVQLLGTTVNFSTYIHEHHTEYFNPSNGVYRFGFNPIAGHLRQLIRECTDSMMFQRYPAERAAFNRTHEQINYAANPDFWWVHAWRDRLQPSFVICLTAVQIALIAAGVFLVRIGLSAPGIADKP